MFSFNSTNVAEAEPHDTSKCVAGVKDWAYNAVTCLLVYWHSQGILLEIVNCG